MKTELIKRTFEAIKYPIGSEKRKKLNLKPETSEYMTSMKYIVKILIEETKYNHAYIQQQTFKTKTEAEMVITLNNNKKL